MRYTTTDGPDEPLNAIQEGSLGDKMGIAAVISLTAIIKLVEMKLMLYQS